MSNKSNMIAHAIAAVLTVGSIEATAETMEMSNIKGMEKCYGVAKAHHNDCGTSLHGCAGEAKVGADPKEYILVPTGLCQKIVGGKTKAS